MPKLSKRLKVYKVKDPRLGEIVELYSPWCMDGNAYFIDQGVGIRLTTGTAAKLGHALLKLVAKGPGKGVKK